MLKKILNIRKRYDEVNYWNKRDNPNTASAEITKRHINYVKENLNDCSIILDFGCGVGRIFPAYDMIRNVYGYDISDRYKNDIIEKSKSYNFNINITINKKVEELPFINNMFDAVVCVSVLLHQTPRNINLVMNEMARVGKKVIVVTYMDTNFPFDNEMNKKTESKHCYNYDYIKICKENCYNIKYKIYDQENQQLFFTYSKN